MTEGTCPRCHGSGQPRSLWEATVLDKCIRCGGSGRTTNPTAPTDDFRIAVMEAEQRAYERGYADGRGTL
jgi:DnaJ-class molecular chaperone